MSHYQAVDFAREDKGEVLTLSSRVVRREKADRKACEDDVEMLTLSSEGTSRAKRQQNGM